MSNWWYPGHMKKTRDMLTRHLGQVGLVLEVLDARIPSSSQNPDLGGLLGPKQRVILLNKADLAEPGATSLWVKELEGGGIPVAALSALRGQGLGSLRKLLARYQPSGQRGRRPVRALVVGIPNVGKSSLINFLAGKAVARTGKVPGITRGKQWINIPPGIELLDSPGLLWPKVQDSWTGFTLAATGAVKFELLDLEGLACQLLEIMVERDPARLASRYRLDRGLVKGKEASLLLKEIGKKRGFLLPGGQVDITRGAGMVLKEFREGLLGPITLEYPSHPGAGTAPGMKGEGAPGKG